MNNTFQYSKQIRKFCGQCCHFYVSSHGACCCRCISESSMLQTRAQCDGFKSAVDRISGTVGKC